MHISFFSYTLSKTCAGVTLKQKGLSGYHDSPRCLTVYKQTTKSFNFKNTKIDRLPSERDCMCQSEGET